jgi:hypothetical protein
MLVMPVSRQAHVPVRRGEFVRGCFKGIKKKAIPFQEWLKASYGGRPALCTAVTLFAAIRGKNGPCLLIRLQHD